MRDGHIAAVEVLKSRTDDKAAIKEAETLFAARKAQFSGFEVWDRARFLYRYPSDRPSGGET
ncbi:MAG: hypothetical protein KGJ66_04700 [Alphaproteobacteria bacterium]|nr:hypothetical protein [Alphaproteobacteria bacterium]